MNAQAFSMADSQELTRSAAALSKLGQGFIKTLVKRCDLVSTPIACIFSYIWRAEREREGEGGEEASSTMAAAYSEFAKQSLFSLRFD